MQIQIGVLKSNPDFVDGDCLSANSVLELTMRYLMWQDLTRAPTADKIAAGCAAYTARFGSMPDTVLVHTTEATEVTGLQVRGQLNIRPGNYWIGVEGQASNDG